MWEELTVQSGGQLLGMQDSGGRKLVDYISIMWLLTGVRGNPSSSSEKQMGATQYPWTSILYYTACRPGPVCLSLLHVVLIGCNDNLRPKISSAERKISETGKLSVVRIRDRDLPRHARMA